jgi:hypothetical protein
MPSRTATKPGLPFRVIAGVLIAALIALAASLETAQFVRQYNREYKDPYQIKKQDARFQGLKAILPPDPVLGYVSDKQQSDPQGAAMFFGAQYALAPRILVREPGPRQNQYVIGNFTRLSDFSEVARLLGMKLKADLGDGVVLFEREAR